MKKIFRFSKGKAGRKAYMVSHVWKLGFHIFLCDDELVFRICYLKNKNGTHYIQMAIKVKESLDCANVN